MEQHTHIGAISDASGRFNLKIPVEFTEDSLSISFIGFRPVKLAVQQLKSEQIIGLEPYAIVLKEVIIKDQEVKLRNIFLQAAEHIPDNYPNRLHQLEGLYRSLSTERDQYTRVHEAMIILQDKSYKSMPENIQIQVTASRETRDYGNIDEKTVSTNKKVQEKIANEWKASVHPIYRLYESNFLRISTKEHTHFHLSTLRKYLESGYRFDLMDIETIDGDTIYQIAFTSGPPNGVHLPSGKSYVKVNLSNYAIEEYQITSGVKNMILHQVHVKFNEFNGRYYPRFIQVTQPRFINQEMNDGEFEISTLWFDAPRDAPEKLKSRDIEDRFSTEITIKPHSDWRENSFPPLSPAVLNSIRNVSPEGKIRWINIPE